MICRHSASRVSRSRSLLASFGHPPGRGCGRAGQMGRAEHMGMDACRDQSRHDCRPRQHPARTTGPRPTQGFTALDGVPLSGSTPNPYEIGLGDVRALENKALTIPRNFERTRGERSTTSKPPSQRSSHDWDSHPEGRAARGPTPARRRRRRDREGSPPNPRSYTGHPATRRPRETLSGSHR